MTRTVSALAAPSGNAPFERTTIERRDVGPHDVLIDIVAAGICHSDIHQVREEWGAASFPMVPGHEIAGVVTEVGAEVTRHAVGDRVGVGCMVDSCRECEYCRAGEEQFCTRGAVMTYNAQDYTGAQTYGGYAGAIAVDEHFVVRIPDALPLDAAAPLLCAGITTYSPLRRWGAGPGRRVAVVGLGGLGHLAVRIAAAMGAEVTVISRTLAKADEARRLGAHHVVATEDAGAIKALRGSLDLIVNTVSADLDHQQYVGMLRLDGVLASVGIGTSPISLRPMSLLGMRRVVTGSSIGGIRETQEMLDFCAEHDIVAEIETIAAEPAAVDAAYDRVVDGDVRFRAVIDVAALR